MPGVVLSAKKKTNTTTHLNETTKTTQAAQTEPQTTTTTTTATQTTSDRREDTAETCVSRVDPNICIQDDQTHNVDSPTMGNTTQLEASHEMVFE